MDLRLKRQISNYLYENESYAIIYGYATKKEIENAPVSTWDKVNPIEDYSLSYKKLNSIRNLIDILKIKNPKEEI